MDGLTPHLAGPIDPASRETQYKESLSFYGQKQRDWRLFGIAGLVVGLAGLVAASSEGVAIAVMMPLKQTVVRWIEVDSATGWHGDAVASHDAPKMFNDRVQRRDIVTFIKAWEGYDPIQDHTQWKTVRAMSSAELFSNYNAERKSDVSPVKQLSLNGHVEIKDGSFLWGKPIKQPDGTTIYVVEYQKRQIKEQNVSEFRPYHATIVYRYDPDKKQKEEDAEINDNGFEALRFNEEGS